MKYLCFICIYSNKSIKCMHFVWINTALKHNLRFRHMYVSFIIPIESYKLKCVYKNITLILNDHLYVTEPEAAKEEAEPEVVEEKPGININICICHLLHNDLFFSSTE